MRHHHRHQAVLSPPRIGAVGAGGRALNVFAYVAVVAAVAAIAAMSGADDDDAAGAGGAPWWSPLSSVRRWLLLGVGSGGPSAEAFVQQGNGGCKTKTKSSVKRIKRAAAAVRRLAHPPPGVLDASAVADAAAKVAFDDSSMRAGAEHSPSPCGSDTGDGGQQERPCFSRLLEWRNREDLFLACKLRDQSKALAMMEDTSAPLD